MYDRFCATNPRTFRQLRELLEQFRVEADIDDADIDGTRDTVDDEGPQELPIQNDD